MQSSAFLEPFADGETTILSPTAVEIWDTFPDPKTPITHLVIDENGLRPMTSTIEMCECPSCESKTLLTGPTKPSLRALIERHERDAHGHDVTITDIGDYANERGNGN